MIKLKDIVKEFDVSDSYASEGDNTRSMLEAMPNTFVDVITGGLGLSDKQKEALKTKKLTSDDTTITIGDIWKKGPKTRRHFLFKWSERDKLDKYLKIVPVPTRLKRASILSGFLGGKKVYSDGQLLVIRYHVSSINQDIFVMFDTGAESLDTFIIGRIQVSLKTYELQDPVTRKALGIKQVPHVSWSTVQQQLHGKGYGSKLYDAVLNTYGVLASDMTLFKGSFNMWSKHMTKKAFFGLVFQADGGYPLVIPVDTSVASDTGVLRDSTAYRFIAIADPSKISKPLLNIQQFIKGVDVINNFCIMTGGGISVKSDLKVIKWDDYGWVDDEKENQEPTVGTIIELIEDNCDTILEVFDLLAETHRDIYPIWPHEDLWNYESDMGKITHMIIALKDAVLTVKKKGSSSIEVGLL